MRDRAFFDTNILVYLYSEDEPQKRNIAIELISETHPMISLQVLKEFSNTLRKKYKAEWSKIKNAVHEIENSFVIIPSDALTVSSAISIAEKYHYSFYDSLIIASALESNCKSLFSEDLQHKQKIENKISIINPFKH